MSILKKIVSVLLCAIMVLSIAPIFSYKAEAAVAYPKIEALKVPRIYQKSSEAELGMCHINSYASIIAYKLGTYNFDGYKRTYSYGDYSYSNDPVWNKMLDVHYSYDPTGGASKYPVPITNRQVSGNTKETYEIIYEQLAMGKPVVVYSSTNPHASVVIGYTASTSSLDVSKFTVMEISDSWKNSKSIFDKYANSPMTSSSYDSCYMTLKAWLSRGGYELKSVSYYSEPSVTINTSHDEYSVGETNAVLCGEVANPAGAKISKGGIKLYDASGKLLKNYSETFSYTYKILDIWYNMKSELGYTLSSGTEYQYQLYAVVGGNTYTSRMCTFKTTGTASHTLSVYYNANGGSISSDTYYLSSGDIYKYSNSSKHCQKWTYNDPQKDGLYNATTFGISKSGYEFLGWSTTSSGEIWFDQNDTGLLPTDLNPNIKNGDCSVTLYAVWRKVSSAYTLSYNANGGSGAPASQSGATSYTVSSTKPTKSGYTFLGWSTSSSAASASYYAGDTITISSNTTLYAVWEESTTHNVYELAYDANGGTGAPNSRLFEENETVFISEEKPTRFGYLFMGWNTQSNGNGTWYSPGDEVTFDESLTLYAMWQVVDFTLGSGTILEFGNEFDEYYIRVIPTESGTFVIESMSTEYNLDMVGALYSADGTELIFNDDISAEDGNFKFSYYLEAGKTYYIYVKPFTVTTGTAYLLTKEAYSVYFDANGGYGAPDALTGDYKYIIPDEEPYKEGYKFIGWSMDSDNSYFCKTPGDEIEIIGDCYLYAVWEDASQSFTVYYDANGGTDAPPAQFVSSDEVGYVPYDEPVRAGYSFKGWCTQSDGNGVWYYSGNALRTWVVMEDMVLYAIWSNENTSISVFTLSIRTPSTTTISYGDSIILHADVTGALPEGATIQWSTDNGNFEKVASNDGKTCRITPASSGNTTFTVKVVSVEGEVLAEDTQVMTSKAGFFDKIIAFFKRIFGLLKEYPQVFRGI